MAKRHKNKTGYKGEESEMAERKRKPGRPPGSKNKNTAGRGKNSGREAAKKKMDSHVRDEIWAIVIVALGAFLAIAFQTHAAGAVGEGLSDFFKGCLGMMAYVFPYYLILYGILLFAKKTIHIGRKSLLLLFIILLMAAFLNSARFIDPQALGFYLTDAADYYKDGILLDSGGLLGMYIGSLLVKAFGIPGLYIISIVVILICLLLVINTPISRFFERAAEKRRLKKEAEEEDEEEGFLPEPKAVPFLTKDTAQSPLADCPEYMEPVKKEKERRVPIWERLRRERPEGQSGSLSSGQQKILEYMENDDLFGSQADTSPGYGLGSGEEKADTFGLEPAYGLDGTVPRPEPGMGLDGDFADSAFEPASAEKTARKEWKNQDEALSPGTEDIAEDWRIQEEIPTAFGLAQAASGKTGRTQEKLTNSQAAKAALDPEEIKEHTPAVSNYQFPPVTLLKKGRTGQDRTGRAGLRSRAAKLEETLHNFNIDAEIVQVIQGPTITRYEIHPNVGVKVKKIVNLADDIALNLAAKSIRIEAPIPGKAAVGIEIENEKRETVTIREMIDSDAFRAAESKITFAVGKDVAGNIITADMKAMPHLLIAGSTGSGKSVCVNSIITSILYKAKPEEVKLVLIDPKVVELSNYNGIPHLLIPVVTDPKKAAAALNWAVAEMEDRYHKFAAEGVRDLGGYNETIRARGEGEEVLPQVVIIIDELADLRMAAPAQVEDSICRLAQKARAAGMHLIVATQRPSVDVITGVIKANIPSRIAFAVSSQIDSRTILDMGGAEKLAGKGDMLFYPMGSSKPVRIQGPFISDSEVQQVIDFVKGQVEQAEYSDDVIHTIEKADTQESAGDADELLSEAIEFVVTQKEASVSMLQRRFRVGYNRAARIVDQMEARGIIGPAEGSKKRQVLMTEEELRGLREDTEDIQEE